MVAIEARVKTRIGFNRAIKAGLQRFKDDPNYRPDLFLAGFTPREEPIKSDDEPLLKRIMAAYKKAKADQKLASETFKVSNEWLPIYEHALGPVMRALSDEDVPQLHRMYANFFRDPCCQGLFGLPLDEHKKLFLPNPPRKCRNLVEIDKLHRFNLWKQRTKGKYSTSQLASPLIGNPCGYILDGIFIRGGSDYQHYYAQAISSLLPSGRKSVVIELGGGFGGMAYFLCRDNPNMTYIDFDLPEALALASYYLIKALPDVRVSLYGESELAAEVARGCGIVMMPSFEITRMPSKSADVAFNSYSLAEMSPSSIREYIAEITRITAGHFLHVNHNRDSIIKADDFGVESHGFDLINRQLAGWTLGINPNSDEFEYLYRAR